MGFMDNAEQASRIIKIPVERYDELLDIETRVTIVDQLYRNKEDGSSLIADIVSILQLGFDYGLDRFNTEDVVEE